MVQIQNDIQTLKQNYITLKKINKVGCIIDRNLKLSSTREQVIEDLKKVKKDFKQYYSIYNQMDNILKKYEKNVDFHDKIGDDNYEKLYSTIKRLNDLKIGDLYKEIFNSGLDDDNQDGSEMNGRNEREFQNLLLERRQQELQELKQFQIISERLKEITQNMVEDIDTQKKQLDAVEMNVEKAPDNSIQAKKEIEEADSKKNSKRLHCLIYIIVIILIVIIILIAILIPLTH